MDSTHGALQTPMPNHPAYPGCPCFLPRSSQTTNPRWNCVQKRRLFQDGRELELKRVLRKESEGKENEKLEDEAKVKTKAEKKEK